MISKIALFLSVILALALATAVGIQQRTLKDLRAGNDSLRRDIETQVAAESLKPAAEVSPARSAAELSAEEKAELLRLRGQIPSLRSEAAAAADRVARASNPAPKSSSSFRPSSARQMPAEALMNAFMKSQAFRSADDFSKAIQRHLSQHGQLPVDLTLLEAADGTRLPPEVVQRFEMFRSGALVESEGPRVLVAREKEPRQLPDGNWVRLYIQANGGVTVAGPVNHRPPADDSSYVAAMDEFNRKAAARQHLGSPH
jgi:hypothetical protein